MYKVKMIESFVEEAKIELEDFLNSLNINERITNIMQSYLNSVYTKVLITVIYKVDE
jgi:lysyl-tRNA synthetase class I